MNKSFLILFLFISNFLFSQYRTSIIGEASAGGVLIGRADNIKSVLFDKKKLSFSKDGFFVFGFDRDAAGTYTLKVTFKDKKTETIEYEITPREYKIQAINGFEKKMVTPGKKERIRIARETKIISAEKKKPLSGGNAYFKNGFITPVDSVDISGVFGSLRVLNGKKKNPHNGVDYSADEGTPVKAAGEGVVLVARENFYYNGTFIMIDHGFGLITSYLHLSKLNVKRGDKVSKGDVIGEVGSTGRTSGAHLHFGAQIYNKRIDPFCLLKIKTEEPQTGK